MEKRSKSHMTLKEARKSSLELRHRAEDLITRRERTSPGNRMTDIDTITHELSVHQIELELQNEELRNANLEAQQARDKYFDLYDMAPVGYVTLDWKGEILEVNLTGTELFGLPRQDLTGRRIQVFLLPSDIPIFNNFQEEVLLSSSKRCCEVTLSLNGGVCKILRIEGVRQALEIEGKPTCRTALIDITERKRAEEERLELERRLLYSQKLESLGTLSRGIAHDFNNLLSAVLGNLDVALLTLPSSDGRQGIERAIVAARRAAHLTNQILAYSGKSRFTVSRFDASDLVRDNVVLFRTAIPRRINLNLSLSCQPSMVEADPSQMQQVIMNLITNASDAIGEMTGEIELITGVDDFRPDYLSRSRIEEKPEAGRFAYLEVSDTGCGMDEETQQRFFDPFFTTKSTGRGLGMSVVLGIVRGHKGAILVKSAKGQGTTIRVLIPACSHVAA